jgi:hypothetical protein
MTTVASTATYTHYFEGTQKVFPCRCGQTHRGDYAEEDYTHHTCFHTSALFKLPLIDGVPEQVVCMECGNLWDVET